MIVRGQIVLAKVPDIDAPKYFLVVSNNARNAKLPSVLAVRITTSPKPDIPSVVELRNGEVLRGRVLCDSIQDVWEDEVVKVVGALSPASMMAVGAGLRAALAL